MEMRVADVPVSLNKVLRMHWLKRQALQQAWAWMVRIALGRPATPCRTKQRVTITLYHSRLYDLDNAFGGAGKIICDALKANGLIVDDSPEWLELIVKQEKCKHRERHTVIKLEAI